MTTTSAKLLGPAANFAVVQLPGRRYPGVIVQGDTLKGIVEQLTRMKELLALRQLETLTEEIDELSDQLSQALSYYQKICADNSIQ